MRKTILFFTVDDWAFYNFRRPLAQRVREAGCNVVIITQPTQYEKKLKDEGFEFIPINLNRKSINPIREIRSIFELVRIYKKRKPDLVHHFALKPVIYGSLAAFLTRIPTIINTITGFGYVFSSKKLKAKLLKPIILFACFFLFKKSRAHITVQNSDDYEFVVNKIVPPNRLSMIPGSGVNIRKFTPYPEPPGVITITMVSRMLKEKGIIELIEAARLVKKERDIRIVLVGKTDPHNPSSINKKQLLKWDKQGITKWDGQCDDIEMIWKNSHVAVLPSYYREGLPKSLLEAAACGRPIITTDVPGCRELVKHNENGIIVSPRDPSALAKAILLLANNKELRIRLGKKRKKKNRNTLFR